MVVFWLFACVLFPWVSCLWFRSGLWLLTCLVFCGIVCGLQVADLDWCCWIDVLIGFVVCWFVGFGWVLVWMALMPGCIALGLGNA